MKTLSLLFYGESAFNHFGHRLRDNLCPPVCSSCTVDWFSYVHQCFVPFKRVDLVLFAVPYCSSEKKDGERTVRPFLWDVQTPVHFTYVRGSVPCIIALLLCVSCLDSGSRFLYIIYYYVCFLTLPSLTLPSFSSPCFNQFVFFFFR